MKDFCLWGPNSVKSAYSVAGCPSAVARAESSRILWGPNKQGGCVVFLRFDCKPSIHGNTNRGRRTTTHSEMPRAEATLFLDSLLPARNGLTDCCPTSALLGDASHFGTRLRDAPTIQRGSGEPCHELFASTTPSDPTPPANSVANNIPPLAMPGDGRARPATRRRGNRLGGPAT